MKYILSLSIVLFTYLSFPKLSAQSSISIHNTFSSSDAKINTCDCKDGSKGQCSRSDLSLLDLIPTSNLQNTTSSEITPSHLVDFKNAIDHYTYEVVQNGKKIATIISTETEGNVYENVNEVCNRTEASKLEKVYKQKFSSEYNFIVSKITSNKDETTFKCNFSLVNHTANKWSLESHWNIEDYSKGGATFNFQISTSTMVDLGKIVNEFLDHFADVIHLTEQNMGKEPHIYAKSAAYLNKTISIKIANPQGLKSLKILGSSKLSEMSTPIEFERDIQLSGASEEEIKVSVDGLYDVTLQLSSDSNHVSDQIYVADGRWSLYNPQASAVLHKFEISQDLEREADKDSHLVERNVGIKGRIKRNISITKNLDRFGRSIDFSTYESFDFVARGNANVDVVLVSSKVVSWDDQLKTTIVLSSDEQTLYQLTKEHFGAEEADWNSITRIVFVVKGSGTYIPVDLEISELKFVKQEQVIQNAEKQELVDISPNPMIFNANVSFTSTSEMPYKFQVWSISGELVQSISGKAFKGSNDLTISRKGLEAGNYITRLTTDEGSVRVRRLVIL